MDEFRLQVIAEIQPQKENKKNAEINPCVKFPEKTNITYALPLI
jgi:hypothetical protein